MARTAKKKIAVYDEGVLLTDDADSINFVGAGVIGTVIFNDVTETISGSGDSGQQPTSGVINGINQVFVFASTPSLICVDQGRFMQKVSSDGTINWTGSTTITLTVAPTFDIFAI